MVIDHINQTMVLIANAAGVKEDPDRPEDQCDLQNMVQIEGRTREEDTSLPTLEPHRTPWLTTSECIHW